MKIIQNKKDMLALLRSIGAEEPLICVDELELRHMFENATSAILNEPKCKPSQLRRCLEFYLVFFKGHADKDPKAVYFKVTSAVQLEMQQIESLRWLAENAGVETRCIFACDVHNSKVCGAVGAESGNRNAGAVGETLSSINLFILLSVRVYRI